MWDYTFKDGILIGRLDPSVNKLTAEVARNGIYERLMFSNGHEYPLLHHAPGVNEMTKEAHDILGSELGFQGVTATAILTHSLIGRVISNLWLRLQKPKKPVRFFTSKEEAMKWLKQYRKEIPAQ